MQEEEPVGSRRPLNRAEIDMIAFNIGLGAIILDLHLVDYTRGSMLTEKDTRCFWLTDGRCVRITVTRGAGVIASVSKKPDPKRPEPLEG